MISISSCGTSARGQLKALAEQRGKIEAGINIGPQPEVCGEDTPHAPLVKGQDKVVTLDRERGQLDKANDLREFCFNFRNDQAKQLRK